MMHKIMRFISLALMAALLFSFPVDAQKKQKDSRAQAAFDAGEYYEAIDLYKNAYNKVDKEKILQVEAQWKQTDAELLGPMTALLHEYYETLQKGGKFLALTRDEFDKIIDQLRIPKKEKRGIKDWLRDLPGSLTVETLGNFLWTYGPTILHFLGLG